VALRLGQPPEQLARAPGEARLTRPLVLGAAGEFGQGSVEAQAMGLLQVAAASLLIQPYPRRRPWGCFRWPQSALPPALPRCHAMGLLPGGRRPCGAGCCMRAWVCECGVLAC